MVSIPALMGKVVKAAKSVFNPTPEQVAEREKRRRIHNYKGQLHNAVMGCKVVETSEEERRAEIQAAAIAHIVSPMMYRMEDIGAKEQEARINLYSQKLEQEGLSEKDINAVIQDARKRCEASSPDFPFTF